MRERSCRGSRTDLGGDKLLVASRGCWPRIFNPVYRAWYSEFLLVANSNAPEVAERRCHRRVDYLAYRFSQCSSIAFAETLKMYSPLYQRLRCCGPRTC